MGSFLVLAHKKGGIRRDASGQSYVDDCFICFY